MDCEMIALVDENDKIIGYGNEEEVHENGILHRAVTLILDVHYEGLDYILIRKSKNLWTSSCRTHVKEGEEVLDAVLRTAKEKLGLSIPKEDYSPDCSSLYYRPLLW